MKTEFKIWASAGLVVGSICAVLSWLGNVPGRASIFPDLPSLLAPPLLVAISLRLGRRRFGDSTAQGASKVLLGFGAVVFATIHFWMLRELHGFKASLTGPFGFALFLFACLAFILMGSIGVRLSAWAPRDLLRRSS